MKHFLIKYRLDHEPGPDWHDEIARFAAQIENDPDLKGTVSYRSFRTVDGEYYHFASALDENTVARLNQTEFFERYTEKVERVSGGRVEVVPLELVAETALRL